MSSVAELRQLRLARKKALEAKRSWDRSRSEQDASKDDKRSQSQWTSTDYSETNSMSSTSRFRESRSHSRARSLRNGSGNVQETTSMASRSLSRGKLEESRPSAHTKPVLRGASQLHHEKSVDWPDAGKSNHCRAKPQLKGAIIYHSAAACANRSRSRSTKRNIMKCSRPACGDAGRKQDFLTPDSSDEASAATDAKRAVDDVVVKVEQVEGRESRERKLADPLAEFWSERPSERYLANHHPSSPLEDKETKPDTLETPTSGVHLLKQKRMLLLAKKRKEASQGKSTKMGEGQTLRKLKMIRLKGRRDNDARPTKKAKLAPWRPISQHPQRGLANSTSVSDWQDRHWSSRCKAWHDSNTEEGGLEINMSGENLADETMNQWCCWMATKLNSCSGITKYKAKVVDFSRNRIGDAGTHRLLQLFERHAVTCDVLKLYKNELTDEALMEVTKYLTSFNRAPVRELHMSHNRITCQGVKWLLASLAMHPAYPRWCECQRQYVPLWLRLEMNDISNAQGVELLKACTEELDISVCLMHDSGCSSSNCSLVQGEVKHNCIAHLWHFVDDVSIPIPFRVSDHRLPLFADPTIKIPWSIKACRQKPFLIYEDDDIACVFKPSDWICTPTGLDLRWGDWCLEERELKMKQLMHQSKPASLHAWIVLHFGRRNAFTAKQQFGLVHRLDRDTSGPVLVGKTDRGYSHCKNQVFSRSMMKDYLCLVHGRVEDTSGECHAPIDGTNYKFNRTAEVNYRRGSPAISIFEPVAFYEHPRTGKQYSLVHVRIVTGRTHQIRLHMNYLGHPLVGERKYLKNWSMIKGDIEICKRIFLHKYRIGFTNLDSTVIIRSCTLQMSWDLWNAVQKKLRQL